MDEQQARQRLLEGGYFVALGVPPGVDFGIDVKSYQTGPQFKGVKMIPAGLHFAHYGTGEGEKQGFFFRSAAGTVAATQWDASAEDLVDAQACLPHGALQALREAVLRLEMDANLGPYPFEQRAAWLNLTNCVSDSVLQRCGVPIGAKVLAGSSEAEAGEPGGLAGVDKDSSGGPKSGKMRAGSGMEIVPHFPHIGRVARFCEVPGREILTASRDVADAGAAPPVDPREVTKRIMDGSEALQQLIASNFGGEWMELLGEFQLSFVLFVSLSSLRGFRHWQALSALLCRCGDALSEHPTLFTAFIRMLHAHLKLVPEDFFDVELSKDNFLVSCLSALVQNVLPDESLAPTLRDAAKRLLKFLQQRFGIFLGGNSTTPMSTSPQIVVGPKERSSHPDSAFLHDGMDEESVEVLEEAGDNGGLGSVESLNLLQLELSEEDQPTVVPYEEVARALGSDAFDSATPPSAMHQRKQRGGGLAGAGSTPGMQAADHIMGELSSPAASAALNTSREATGVEEGKKNTTALPLSAPSAEHSRRWQDIDRLLSAAATPPQLSTPPHHAQQPQPVELPVSTVNIGGAGATPAAAAATAAGGYAAAAATRYPLLFASTGANEDVMMAAARLVSSEDGEGAGGGAGAAVQAMAFLEEVGASEDGGAAIWQLSAGLPGRRNAAEGGTISSN